MSIRRILFATGVATLIAGVSLVSKALQPTDPALTRLVGQSSIDPVPQEQGEICRTAPPSFCNRTYSCDTDLVYPEIWECVKCTVAPANFNTCRIGAETDTCDPDETTNPCGDLMEDFAPKVEGQSCSATCIPSSVIGKCTEYFNLYGC